VTGAPAQSVDDDGVERFRELLRARLGLRFEDGQRDTLGATLVRRARTAGRAPADYLARLASAGARAELRALAQELTVGETYFFRNAEHLRALAEVALPARGAAEPARRPLRVLSAGCATGEEPYSLAILAREELERAGLSVAIHAFDVNPAALERAALGRYSAWALRETLPEIRGRYFRPDGRDLILDERLRELVTFEERNLAEEDVAFWRANAFDAVFCRNVLMYLATDVAQAAVARFARCLTPGGFLFLGYAETVRGLSHDFHLRHSHGGFYYQRREGGREGKPLFVEASPPSRAAVAESMIGAASPDLSWVETIRRASERIESLTSPPGGGTSRAAGLRPSGARVDVSRAVELLRHERFDDARISLADLPPEAARDPDVLLLRAVLLSHGGDFGAVEALCREVLALEELSAGAHYLTALCREDAGAVADAIQHDRIAVHLDPTFALPRLHLGLLARRRGDHAAARRELGEALPLLEREDAARLSLYGGGFGRAGLVTLCRAELRACGGSP
jgi:chemotaxis protein methyltransferase CheR